MAADLIMAIQSLHVTELGFTILTSQISLRVVRVFQDEEQLAVKMSRKVKKRMVVVFFSKRGILNTTVLDKQKNVTAN